MKTKALHSPGLRSAAYQQPTPATGRKSTAIAIFTMALLLAPSVPAQELPSPASPKKAAAAALQKAASPEARRAAEEFHAAKLAAFGEMQLAKEQAAARGADAKGQREAALQWQMENAGRMEAVRDLAVRLAKASEPVSMPLIRQIPIPANASPELEELLVEKARMYNERTRLENRLGRSSPEAAQAIREWEAGNRERFAAQNERARAVAAQTSDKSIPIPLAPAIPRAASPELRAFITERHTLLRERAEALEQVKRLDPAARQQALAAGAGSMGAAEQHPFPGAVPEGARNFQPITQTHVCAQSTIPIHQPSSQKTPYPAWSDASLFSRSQPRPPHKHNLQISRSRTR